MELHCREDYHRRHRHQEAEEEIIIQLENTPPPPPPAKKKPAVQVPCGEFGLTFFLYRYFQQEFHPPATLKRQNAIVPTYDHEEMKKVLPATEEPLAEEKTQKFFESGTILDKNMVCEDKILNFLEQGKNAFLLELTDKMWDHAQQMCSKLAETMFTGGKKEEVF